MPGSKSGRYKLNFQEDITMNMAIQDKSKRKPYFSEEHEIFRKAFRKFLDKEAYPYFEEWEEKKEVPK